MATYYYHYDGRSEYREIHNDSSKKKEDEELKNLEAEIDSLVADFSREVHKFSFRLVVAILVIIIIAIVCSFIISQ